MLPKFLAASSSSSSSSPPSPSMSVFAVFPGNGGEEHAMARRVGKGRSRLNVEEEYKKSLRTKSFIDILNKAQHKLGRTSISASSQVHNAAGIEGEEDTPQMETLDSNSSYYTRLPDLLLEPNQEILVTSSAGKESFHRVLLDFFDVTNQAFNACTSLLISLNRTRSHHRTILHLLLSLSGDTTAATFSQLSSFLNRPNPLSPHSLSNFNLTHALLDPLSLRLTAARRRIKKRSKLLRASKKATGLIIAAACAAAAVVALVVACHVVVVFGVVTAVPAVLAKPRERRRGDMETVDAAARGAYIVGRDMETMSRMVRRVEDEVEHGRDVARMALRAGERHMVKEVVKELEGSELGLKRQLEELEEHVYLSLLTINRSRRMVAQEMVAGGGLTATTSQSAAMLV